MVSRVRTLAIILAGALAATAPAATTGPSEQVSTSSATVTGTIAPNGAATTYHVEYGTSTAYGLATGARDVGAGTDPVPVRESLSGLSPNTDYHYRVVAANANGVARGADATFHTAIPVAPPHVVTQVPRDTVATGTVLRGTVDPNGANTEYHFEYGRTLEYGQTTRGGTVAAGAELARLAEPLTGLTPYTRYHARLVATNRAGRTVGADKTFFTLRRPTGVTIAVYPRRPVFGEPLTVSGAVSGEGIDHIEVVLERDVFPFTVGLERVGTEVSSDGDGRYAVALPAVRAATQLRVVTNTILTAESRVVTVPVALKVDLRTKRLRRHGVEFVGAVSPASPRGRASLMRRQRGRGWIKVDRTRLAPLSRNRSRYRVKMRTPRPGRYRVVVAPRDGGAHAAGVSPARRLRRAR